MLFSLRASCFVAVLLPFATPLAQAQTCNSQLLIDETLPTGARWEMCFEVRASEGVVFHDVHFTPPGGARYKVLGEAAVSQIHVPYDDNGARFHDVSDYGLGTSSHLNDLSASLDCPQGTLRQNGTKNVLCQTQRVRGVHSWGASGHGTGYLLELFSVSHVGAYNYIPAWQFHDDGTIEVAIGATGKLQRSTTDQTRAENGWYLHGNTIGLSHLHNYYWRLDFDLGSSVTDDVVQEIDFAPNGSRTTRSLSSTTFTQEVARDRNTDRNRRWRVVDTAQNADGHAISWEIEPVLVGHRDEGPSYEPFTFDDLWVTKNKTCERFASHNPTTGGCAREVNDFTNGESLVGQDLVVWVGLSFHHLPRDEDQVMMPAHWNSFRIIPRDFTATNPLVAAPTNRAPTVNSVPNQSHAEGASVSLQVTGSDPDGDPLSWSANGLPPGLSIHPQSGLITGTIDFSAAGIWNATVTASDGSLTDSAQFSWSVFNTNRPPVVNPVANQSSAEGASVSLQMSGSDPDGQALSWSANNLPANLQIHPQTGLISGTLTFTSSGNYVVTVFASDGAQSGSESFNFQVTEGNRAPELNSPGGQTSAEGNQVTLPISGSDPDGNSLSWSVTGLPPGLGISASTGVISGTISFAASGNYTVTVSASDGSLSDSVSFPWSVSNTNRAPEVSFVGNQQDAEGDSVFLQIEGSDPDGQSLSWSAQGLPTALQINRQTGQITGTLGFSTAGSHPVTVTASDGSLTDSVTFSWSISNTNRAPSLAGINNQNSAEGDAVSVQASGSDPDAGDSLTYSASGLPPGIGIHQQSGLISGTLGFDASGNRTVTVTVSDGEASAQTQFLWSVSNTNRAPNLQGQPNRSGAEGAGVSFQVVASDPDGDSVNFTAQNLPPGISIHPSTGLISGTLAFNAAGTWSCTVRASDGELASAAGFQWTVSNTNRTPVVHHPGNQSSIEGQQIDLVVTASDADGDSLRFSAQNLPEGLSIHQDSGRITGTIAFGESGTHTVSVWASDALNTGSLSFVWAVGEGNVRPWLQAPPDLHVRPGTYYNIRFQAGDANGDELEFSASGLPAGLSIDEQTGVIQGRVALGSAGVYSVTVTADDGELDESMSFTLTVTDEVPLFRDAFDSSDTTGWSTAVGG